MMEQAMSVFVSNNNHGGGASLPDHWRVLHVEPRLFAGSFSLVRSTFWKEKVRRTEEKVVMQIQDSRRDVGLVSSQ